MSPIYYIIRSIIITVIISSIIALLFLNHFWIAFAITTAIQIILFYIVNTIRDVSLYRLENQRIAEYSKQGMLLKCPCHVQNEEFVPIYLNEPNEYNCGACNKPVSVKIEATTLAATIPIDIDNSQEQIAKIYNTLTNGKRDN